VNLARFSTPPIVLDVTDPDQPVQLTPKVTPGSQVGIALQVPWTTTNPAAPVRHTLLAVAADRIASANGVIPNHPSHWHAAQPGADIAMITYEAFADARASGGGQVFRGGADQRPV